MGFPLLLYGLQSLSNASFETDADGATTVTGWTAGGVANTQEVTVDDAHAPSLSLAGTKSVRQGVVDGTGGNNATLRQRIAVDSDLARVIRSGSDGEIGVVAMLKAEGGAAAFSNARIELLQYQGGTATIGSGTPLSPASSRWTTSGGSSLDDYWSLGLRASSLHASADYLEVSLEFDIARGGYDGSTILWDRVFVGGVVDIDRRPRESDPRAEPGVAANEGAGGALELVRTIDPSARIDVVWTNILRGSDEEAELLRLERWLEIGSRPIAAWLDRDELSVAGRHWEKLYHDDRVSIRFPRGVLRRDFSFRFFSVGQGVA